MSLARYAYPNVTPETREQLAKDCFIDSLCDAQLEWAVYQGKPLSLQQAVTLALECEAFQNGRKQRSNFKFSRVMNEIQNTGSYSQQPSHPTNCDKDRRTSELSTLQRPPD